MQTLCDVCERATATLFCTADEAALCRACDHKEDSSKKTLLDLNAGPQRINCQRPDNQEPRGEVFRGCHQKPDSVMLARSFKQEHEQ